MAYPKPFLTPRNNNDAISNKPKVHKSLYFMKQEMSRPSSELASEHQIKFCKIIKLLTALKGQFATGILMDTWGTYKYRFGLE